MALQSDAHTATREVLAIQEIGRLGGTQFDPKAVETYLAIPSTEWVRIRHDIEHLEQVDKRRSTGEMAAIKA